MEKQKPDMAEPKKEYEPPKIKELIELTASGKGSFPPMQVCPTGGTAYPCPDGAG